MPLGQAHELWLAEFHQWNNFEPDDMFEWSVETAEWWRAWTGNRGLKVAPFRVFGRDGTGGMLAFWTRDPTAAVETRPIVFLGSEGETGVIAQNLSDYLWLLASGVGPLEPIFGQEEPRIPQPIPVLTALAEQFNEGPARSAERC
ncbi:SMI1/KNR4 family protein [Paractinoplanes durhamensis]|uniref:SMI1/KNR4 family protein n=1 Tax=Paractinoplanes durhamensis TaxID=113563 RepID=A0ABQ3YQE7_9ACTN|nr:SMI1/KNR4 family protein [Actinoplanes durhamensis]GID99815.1 hypothetical protein Adu01nite_11660 [Actinoplanes durhamensis]